MPPNKYKTVRMKTFLLIISILGIVNSFIIIIYSFVTKKGNKTTNILFAFLIIALTVRISKSILLTFSDGLHDILLTLGLSGFYAIGPVYMLFIDSIVNDKFHLKRKHFLHFLPAFFVLLTWFELDYIRSDYYLWNFFYQIIILQYIIYMIVAITKTNKLKEDLKKLKFELNILSVVLLLIWFLYFLNAVTHFFPYIAGALIYSVIVYFAINLIINKGFVLDFNLFTKYQKTGLNEDNIKSIADKLTFLFEKDKVFKSNTISLVKLAKMLNTSTHQLSQVINSEKHQTYYELLAYYRIEEAKKLIADNSIEIKFIDVAYDVAKDLLQLQKGKKSSPDFAEIYSYSLMVEA